MGSLFRLAGNTQLPSGGAEAALSRAADGVCLLLSSPQELPSPDPWAWSQVCFLEMLPGLVTGAGGAPSPTPQPCETPAGLGRSSGFGLPVLAGLP